MSLDQDLVQLLRCPKCKGPLSVEKDGEEEKAFTCSACRLRFPVDQDLPNFLLSKAEPLSL